MIKILFFYSLDGWDLCPENLLDLLSTSTRTEDSIEIMAECLEDIREGAYINRGEGFMAFVVSVPFPPAVGCVFRVNTFVNSDLFMQDLVVRSIDLMKGAAPGVGQYVFYLMDEDEFDPTT